MAQRQTERLCGKNVERQFLYELKRDFELAPATSRAVLAAAQQVLFPSSANGDVREGQMRVTVVGVAEPSGKPLSAMKKVGMVVTVEGGLRIWHVSYRPGYVRFVAMWPHFVLVAIGYLREEWSKR